MTENKRFTFRVVRDDNGYDITGFDIDDLCEETSYFVDTNTNCVESLVDLLNALHEENIQLKGEVAHYKLLLMSLEKEAKRLSQIKR